MIMSSGLEKCADALWKAQTKEKWEAFEKALKSSGAKYYKLFYGIGKPRSDDELHNFYVEIFDSKFGMLAKAPTFRTMGRNTEDNSAHLIALFKTSKVSELKSIAKAGKLKKRSIENDERAMQRLRALGYEM